MIKHPTTSYTGLGVGCLTWLGTQIMGSFGEHKLGTIRKLKQPIPSDGVVKAVTSWPALVHSLTQGSYPRFYSPPTRYAEYMARAALAKQTAAALTNWP